MKQVMMRRPNRTGDNDLVRVTVLSENNGKMRVKIPGQFHPQEIDAASTVAVGRAVSERVPAVPGSLARDLYR